jgi:hypothetical protein
MKSFGLFEQVAPGLSRCVFDHYRRADAERDCQKCGGQLVQKAA